MGGPVGLLRLLRLLKPEVPPENDFPGNFSSIMSPPAPEPMEDNSMPSLDAYRNYLSKGPPEKDDYQPSTGRKILAHLQGGLAGFSGQKNRMNEILDSPYNEAVGEHELAGKGLRESAGMDIQLNNQKRLEHQNLKATEARLAETKREIAESQRRYEEANRRGDKVEANAERRFLEEQKQRERQYQLDLAQAKAKENKPAATNLQPEVDERGIFTGRAWDQDSGNVVQLPDAAKGFRKKGFTDKMTATVNNSKQSISKAKEMLTIFDELTARGTEGTWHVGKGQGWLSEGLTGSGIINNQKVNDLHMLAQELSNTQLYAMSGAQINNREYDRLRRTLPDTNKGEVKFRQDLERFLKYQQAALDGLLDENTPSDWTLESGGSKANPTDRMGIL